MRKCVVHWATILHLAWGSAIVFASATLSNNDLNGDGLTDSGGNVLLEARARYGQLDDSGSVRLRDSGNQIGGWSVASTCWGDCDGDGDLDLMIAGACDGAEPPQTTRIFVNDGFGHLAEDTQQRLAGVCGGRSSSGWVDVDEDGDLDLFLSGYDGTQYRTLLYLNDGQGNYTLLPQNLTELTSSAMDWGDCDNDGDLDLILAGTTCPYPFNSVTKLYRNDGTGRLTEDTSQHLTGVALGDVAWGDMDNDGDLDLVVSGFHDLLSNPVTKLYRNDGTGTMTEAQELEGFGGSALAWGDYDGDGSLDLVISGTIGGQIPTTRVYHNDGHGNFAIDSRQLLTQCYEGFTAWCDYDNDGDLDLTLSGFVDNDPYSVSEVYYNNGAGVLVRDTTQQLPGTGNGSFCWGDCDRDGDLDLAAIGYMSVGINQWRMIGHVYDNNGSDTVGINTPPLPPSAFSATLGTDSIVFEWNSGSDEETEDSSLTYNLRVGSASGGCDVYYAATMLDTNNVPGFGNCWHTMRKMLRRMSGVDQYFWSVQTVDNGFERSEWAPEQRCSVSGNDPDLPLRPSSVTLFPNIPNPFNAVTTIAYSLPRLSIVQLDVFDVLGRRVATLVNGQVPAGSHAVTCDGTIMSSGVYFYRLQSGSFTDTKKMVLLK